MGSLAALLLAATPLFGFSLQAPALTDSAYELTAAAVAQVEAVDAAAMGAVTSAAAAAATSSVKDAQAQYLQDIKGRNSIASIHRVFGIATWASMTLTLAAGTMAYYNLYGFGAGRDSNPCVMGTAIGGDGGCPSMRTVHALSAGLTTALYATTFTLSLMMPDPDKLSEGKGEFASTLRLHKTLRWVHFGGMVAQALIGVIIANGLFGLDRANNYGALQALGTVHLGVGVVTWGALTWAGALMTF